MVRQSSREWDQCFTLVGKLEVIGIIAAWLDRFEAGSSAVSVRNRESRRAAFCIAERYYPCQCSQEPEDFHLN